MHSVSHSSSSPTPSSSPAHRPVLFASISAWAIVTDFGSVANVHRPVAVHADQDDLNSEPNLNARFLEAFELGDELFATAFNALDGGGANVGRGQRYTRVPRADSAAAASGSTTSPSA